MSHLSEAPTSESSTHRRLVLTAPWEPRKRLLGIAFGLLALKSLAVAVQEGGVVEVVALVAAVAMAYLCAVFCLNHHVLVGSTASLSVRSGPLPWRPAVTIPWNRLQRTFVATQRSGEPTGMVGMARALVRSYDLVGLVDGKRVRLVRNIHRMEAAQRLRTAIESYATGM